MRDVAADLRDRVAITPWQQLVAALALPTILTIIVTVVTITMVGFFTVRLVNVYPIEGPSYAIAGKGTLAA